MGAGRGEAGRLTYSLVRKAGFYQLSESNSAVYKAQKPVIVVDVIPTTVHHPN